MSAVNQVICFLIVFIQLFFNNQVFGQKQELIPLDNPVTMEFLKKNLRKGSPRLVLNHETEKVLKGKLNSDPVIQNIYQAIKINAQEIFDKPIINLDIPMEQRTQDNQLDISRDMLYRVNMLGMTYFLEKDKRFLERLNLEVISACNFPSWNPRHFLDVGENDPNQYYFGGKGGRGTVSHGNLDAGSFVFELFGVRWSVDPGNYSSYGPIERTGFKL